MKRFNLFSIMLAVVIAVSAIGCTTTQGSSEEIYDRDDQTTRQIGNRIYVDDPYRGTIVLERDPYTGRYYDVTPGLGYRSSIYSPYNSGYRTYRNNNTYYRDNRNNTQQQQRTEQEKSDWSKRREEARKQVLGNQSGR